VQKLLYVGKRAMGALEYEPALRDGRNRKEREALEISRLVDEARKIIEGTPEASVPEIMRISSSAGGARAKAVILWNRDANIVRSAFAPMHEGDEHWILKFDGVGELDHPSRSAQPFNRIEYVYGKMAREAGIDIPEMHLLKERGYAHLMIKRFDREDGERVHLHSLGGLEHVDYNVPGAYSYEQYFRVVLRMNLGYAALEEAFRRAVFNILAVNQDDHVKNLSFLMDKSGNWRLSPAYDLTYARGAGYTRTHQMTFAGKAEGLTASDIGRVGKEFGLKRDGADVLEQTVDALGRWSELAREVRVPEKRIKQIRGDFRVPKPATSVRVRRRKSTQAP